MSTVASALGEEVCCLTGVPLDESGNVKVRLNSRVYRRSAAFRRPRYVQAVAWAATVLEILARERPQIVQIATADDGYMGLFLRRWVRLPFVVYAHGNEVLDAIGSRWEKPKLCLHQASRVLVISRFTAQLLERAGVDVNKVEILHPGCDTARFRPLSQTAELRRRILGDKWGNRVILTVGNLVPRKGHDIVIKVLRRLLMRIPQLLYVVVGDGPYRAALEKLALELGVGEQVLFMGRVPDEILPDMYAISDVFAMPSREDVAACDLEGFGLVFLEASACAKPIVAGRSGGIADAVVHGVTGLLVDPADPDDVASALEHLLCNQALAARMGEEGRSRVLRQYNRSQFAAQLRGILMDVVSEKRHN
jgi:phosphatidyl-myo-inositol dimannoside synthase